MAENEDVLFLHFFCIETIRSCLSWKLLVCTKDVDKGLAHYLASSPLDSTYGQVHEFFFRLRHMLSLSFAYFKFSWNLAP